MNDEAQPVPSRMTLQATVQHSEPPMGVPGKPDETPLPSWSDRFSWPGRIALLAAVMCSPWAFGAFEHGAQWGIACLLLVGLAFWWFETAMNRRASQVFPYLVFPIALGLLIGLVQLIGLPDTMASLFLGRQVEIFQNFTDVANQRPSFSVDHEGTWYQIRLLLIAMTALLLGCRYFRSKRDLVILMSAMTFNGVALSIFGIIQKLTFNGKIYWIKEITLGGSPFGPFVNRNNAAGYLLICLACAIGLVPIVMSVRKTKGPQNLISKEMPIWRQFHQFLLDFLAELTWTKTLVLGSVAVIASSIFAALSRGGVIALLAASVATIVAYGMARKPKNSSFVFAPLVVLMISLCGWLAFGNELAQRFERIDLANVVDNDLRIQHWKNTWPAVHDNGILGAGLGSYKGIHRLYRPDQEQVVFHYAENNFFQALVEAGWPGLLLFLTAWFLAFQYANLMLNRGGSPTTIGVAVMGMFLIFSQSIESMFDFGFYIPANMLALAVMFGFLAYHAQSLGNRLKDKSWLRLQVPNYVIQGVVIALFAAVSYSAVDLYHRASIENQLHPLSTAFTRDTPDLDETNARLARLIPMVQNKPTTEGLNYAAALYIHRARLSVLKQLQAEPEYQIELQFLTEEERQTYAENVWSLTDLQRLQENIFFLEQQSRFGAIKFRSQPAILENLPLAIQLLNYSRKLAPLQPVVHLRLAQLKAVVQPNGEGDVDIERALKLSPSNDKFRFVAALYYLQSGNVAACAPHVRKYLELVPRRFPRVLKLLTGRTNRAIKPVDPQVIVEQMIPDDPKMLYALATEYLTEDSQQQNRVFDRVLYLIDQAEFRRHENMVMQGDIYRMRNQIEEAIESYSAALITDPLDRETRYKRALLLVESDELNEALKDAKYIAEHGTKDSRFKNLVKQVEEKIEQKNVERIRERNNR